MWSLDMAKYWLENLACFLLKILTKNILIYEKFDRNLENLTILLKMSRYWTSVQGARFFADYIYADWHLILKTYQNWLISRLSQLRGWFGDPQYLFLVTPMKGSLREAFMELNQNFTIQTWNWLRAAQSRHGIELEPEFHNLWWRATKSIGKHIVSWLAQIKIA